MAKVSKTPKGTREKFEGEQFFDQFTQIGSDEPAEKDDGKAKEPSVADLMAQITALNSRIDTSERTNLALMANPTHEVRSTVVTKPQLDMTKLPDPVNEPEAYATAVAERTNKYISEQFQVQQTQQQESKAQDTRLQNLWGRFEDKYEDYAGDQRKVEFAASEAIREAQARGMDVQKYMFGASEHFFADVVKKMDEVFGKPGKNDPEQDDPTDTSRSTHIFGGLESGGRMSKPSKEDVGDMVKEIHDLQKRTGFF